MKLSSPPIFLTLALLAFLPFASHAQEKQTITVTVTGLGKTVETARKSAIQKAVRKALGEIVDAETIAKNGALIKDEVITYSDGFVSKTLDIAGPTLDEDLKLYSLTLQAEVIRSKVVKRLKEVNIRVVEVDGNSLFAQALTKMDKSESGKKLLDKVLNEDLDPAKLITCELVGLDAGGKLIRGKEALNSPNTIKPIEGSPGQVELTMMWEISVDMDAYYKRALPRISAVINQVSKRKVSGNLKRKMVYSEYNRSGDETYYSHPTRKPIFWGGSGANCLMYDQVGHQEIRFGWLKGHSSTIDFEKEKKNSPWRISADDEEFFVTFELRSNSDRTESDFEVHVLDYRIFKDVFAQSTSRVLPKIMLTAKGREDGTVFQEIISSPKFMVGNNKNKKLTSYKPMMHEDELIYSDKDPMSSEPVGICKSYHTGYAENALSFTISPELVFGKGNSPAWAFSSNLVASSLVMEVKQKLSLDDLKQIKDLVMQPISRNPNE